MRVKKRARSKAEKLEREVVILAVTEKLLRQLGYDEMTMQAVADGSGIAKGTIYLYFKSREELILRVYEDLFDRWIDDLRFCNSEFEGFQGLCGLEIGILCTGIRGFKGLYGLDSELVCTSIRF